MHVVPDPASAGRRSPAGRSSIVDVAARAGVSVATVSRALRDLPNVSPGTRARVLEAAHELGYSASPLASGLVTGRVRAVGVVLPYAGRWFFAEVLRGVEEVLRGRGYDLVLHVLSDDQRRADFFANLPVRRRVDAVLVITLSLDAHEISALRSLDVPLATVGEPLLGIHGDRIDDVAAARVAVQHLINLGHRRIACIGGGADSQHGSRTPAWRTQGYREALRGAGIEIGAGWEQDGRFSAAGGELAMTELLSMPGGAPTAVFCQSDEMAFGAMRALRQSGLSCPGDVSLVGIDDHELSATFDLTTVAQPVADQGSAAAAWLLDHLADQRDPQPAPGRNDIGASGPHDTGPHDTDALGSSTPGAEAEFDHRHPVRLVLRGSTGRPPRHDAM